MEVTKFKRISDGHIYTESKQRSIIDDDRSERSSQRDPPSKYEDPTWSTSGSGSYDAELQAMTSGCSILTEDFAGDELPPRMNEVDKYLSTNDPVGWQREQQRQARERALSPSMQNVPLSPTYSAQDQAAWGIGWSPSLNEGDNSVQLAKDRFSFWSPSRGQSVAKLSVGTKLFRSTAKKANRQAAPLGLSVEGEEDGSDGHSYGDLVPYSKQTCLPSKGRKMLLLSIIVVIIGVATAAAILVPSKRQEENRSVSLPAEEAEDNSSPGDPSSPPDLSADTDSSASTVPISADNTSQVSPEPAAKPGVPCIHLEIHMKSTDQNDVNEWSLERKGKGGNAIPITFSKESETTIVTKDGSQETDQTYKHCVQPGLYTFAISDSSENRLGTDGNEGYYITADGVLLGVSSLFFHHEKMTFALPYEVKDNADGGTSCSDDFFLAIKTDGKPEETSWNVVDRETGQKVLEGGNYEEPWAVYTQRACLPAGDYTLNMKDSGDDGLADVDEGKGFFVLSQYGKTIMDSNGQFGSMKSIDFEVDGGR